MRSTPLPRAKHVNQVLVIAGKAAEHKFLTWSNIILIPGLATVFAFLVSWAFVFEYSLKSGLSVELYFDVIDYIQLTARWGFIFIPLCAASAVLSAWLAFLYFKHPVFASVVAQAVRTRKDKIMVFFVAPLLAFVLLITLAFRIAKFEAESRKYLLVSEVIRKGQSTPVKGKLLFQLSRYVLILAENKYLIAIPQTEVQMIQTPWGLLQAGDKPSPTSAPAVTSSTSPKPN